MNAQEYKSVMLTWAIVAFPGHIKSALNGSLIPWCEKQIEEGENPKELVYEDIMWVLCK